VTAPAESSIELHEGLVLSGRYRLERRVGEGGMGIVWAATHTITRKTVALKFLKVTGDEHVKRFLREARIAGTLRHPNVVEVHDILQMPGTGTPVMVMDLLTGESLAERLERQGRLALHELASILIPVVSAVGSAHALGVIHRDLKPENVFLVASGDVKVLDFGIAKLTAQEGEAAKTAGITHTGAVMGTPFYMAPEQVFGEKTIDHRADIWAMGCIVYECLSGERPIGGDNFGQIFKAIAMSDIPPIQQRVSGLPPDVATLVGRMLARDRDKRPRDLREVLDVFAAHTAARAEPFGAAQSVPPPSVPSQRVAVASDGAVDPLAATSATPPGLAAPARPSEPPKRRAGLFVGAAIAAIVVLGATGAGVVRLVGKRSVPDRPTSATLTATQPPSTPPAPTPTLAPTALATPTATPTQPTPGAKPRPKPATSAAQPADAPKKLPGGVHGDSPY
jgi:serine/threonine-protein kinase